ncbi:hypothetical protein ACF0H5_023612 [Mactra antiquata]
MTTLEGGLDKRKRRKSVHFNDKDLASVRQLDSAGLLQNVSGRPRKNSVIYESPIRARAKSIDHGQRGIMFSRNERKILKPQRKVPRSTASSLNNVPSSFPPILNTERTAYSPADKRSRQELTSSSGKSTPTGKSPLSRKSSPFSKTVPEKIPALTQQSKGDRTKYSKKWRLAQLRSKKVNFTELVNMAKMEPSAIEAEYNRPQIDYATLNVLSTVEEQQRQRHQQHIKGELIAIKKRIKKNLEDLGMESASDSEEDEKKDSAKNSPVPFYDMIGERKRMEERSNVIEKVDKFEEKALLRKQFLTEVMFWFEDNHNLSDDVVTPLEMKEMVTQTEEIHKILCLCLQSFITSGNKVVRKGKQLLEETSKIIEERKAQMAKKTKKERIIVYDDKTLLSDPIKWESAGKTIISVFEDSQKMIKNLMFKNALRLCQKQFDFILLACDKRYKDLDDKKRQCNELQGKLHSAKIQSDRLQKEIDEQKKKILKLTQDMTNAKISLDNMTDKNKDLHFKISELNSKIKFLQDELTEQKNRAPTPPPPPPPPEPEKIYVKVVDSATELKLKEVEAELAEVKVETETLVVQLEEVKEELIVEQQKATELECKVTELEAMELAPATPPAPPPNPPEIPPPPPELPPDKEGNYYKTLMAGMKRDFEIEMEKVKSHVRKESKRGEASIKKMEYQHRDQLAYIQKDTVRMLRGIMHFRDHMLTCLEKENLVDQAQQLSDLGDIVKDKITPEPKEVLATIVSTVVDYLNKMEGILSSSFLAMRILMKYQIEKTVEHEVKQRLALREVQRKDKEMKSQKKNVTGLANCLKKAKAKLKKAKKNIDNFASDKKYLDLLSRYNQMMKSYKNMQKEMEVLHCDFHDTMQKKLEEKETMVISQIKMEMKQKQALAEEQLKMSIADQKANIRMLGRAYEENKISKELHMMATAMIQKTMDIPRRKLRNLFEQYITYRTVQDSKARVARVLRDERAMLSIDTRTEMKNYLESIEGKYVTNMKKWRDNMRELEDEKRELHRKIYKLFNEVLLETGILLVHPLMKQGDKPKVHTMIKAASYLGRNYMNKIIMKKKQRCKEILMLPNEILGKAVPLGQGDSRYWRRQSEDASQGLAPSVVSPHMLAYEVNKPKINASRSLQHRGRKTYILGRTESFHISNMHHVQYIRDIPYHYRQQLADQDLFFHDFDTSELITSA